MKVFVLLTTALVLSVLSTKVESKILPTLAYAKFVPQNIPPYASSLTYSKTYPRTFLAPPTALLPPYLPSLNTLPHVHNFNPHSTFGVTLGSPLVPTFRNLVVAKPHVYPGVQPGFPHVHALPIAPHPGVVPHLHAAPGIHHVHSVPHLHAAPHVHSVPAVPHLHAAPVVPHLHAAAGIPHLHSAPVVPHLHAAPGIPHVQAEPHLHATQLLPHVHSGVVPFSSGGVPHIHAGSTIPHVHANFAPQLQAASIEPHFQAYQLPHVHQAQALPHSHLGH